MTAHRFEEMTKQMVGSQHSRRRLLLGLGSGLTAAAVAGAGLRTASSQDATPTARVVGNGDVAGLVDIGGRSLYLDCRGSGGPTVILESGAGNDLRVWDTVSLAAGTAGGAVLPDVAEFTRVCAYDRPGTFLGPGIAGRSDPVSMPRTAGEIVDDLRDLLAAANVPGPYVMVGHSFGGLVVRLYASIYPADVAGLVLVDAAHEDYYAAARQLMTLAQWDMFVRPAADPDYPNLERIDTEASATEMREAALASPLSPMPLVVITHGMPWDWGPGFDAAALEHLWLPLQQKLASLTPDARLVVAEESGHFIQLQQPELVVAAIRQVVEAVLDPDSWKEQQAPTLPPGHSMR